MIINRTRTIRRSVLFWSLALIIFGGCIRPLKMEPTPVIANPMVDVSSDSSAPFLAGFGVEVITPSMKQPVYLSGYNFMRMAHGVHDDIFARALVVKQGDEKLALVSLDLVGVQRSDAEIFKAGVAGFRPDQIIIYSTHSHAGPDTMGIYALPPIINGKDREHMAVVGDGIARAIETAEREAREVEVFASLHQIDPTLIRNIHEGEPKDDTMSLLVFRDGAGVVATLVNVAVHPEVMWKNNHQLSSDFPSVIYREIEARHGGGAMWMSGALGALQTPNVPGPEKERDWDTMEEYGLRMIAEIEKGYHGLEKVETPSIVHKTSYIVVAVENQIYPTLARFGMIERSIYEGMSLMTEVNLVEFGAVQFVTFPGEAYPKLGLNVRARQKPLSFQIGLANDELGYIIYPEDYNSEMYSYEASLCPTPQLAVEVEKEIFKLLDSQ